METKIKMIFLLLTLMFVTSGMPKQATAQGVTITVAYGNGYYVPDNQRYNA
jgi:hypothetical protein